MSLYNDKKLLKKLSSHARISADMHSSKHFVESILDVYKIAINNNKKEIIPLVGKIKDMLKKGDDHEKDNSIKS